MTLRGVLIAGIVWIVYTIAAALPIMSYSKIPLMWAIVGQLQSSAIMALTSIPIWLLVVSRLAGANWLWKLGVHVCVAPLYAYTNYLIYITLLERFAGRGVLASVERVYQWIIFMYGIIYILQFAIYHGVEAIRQLRYREQQAIELLALSREQELAALKSQINPHFFFNTLNSISAMVSLDVNETRSMIAQLADLLRRTIDSAKRDLVPLREELEFTQSYLSLETKRLSDRLTIEYDMPEVDLDWLVPSMVIQPLVENAVKHGIEPSETGGTVRLRIEREDDRIAICIRDTGVGFQGGMSEVGNGIGLRNTDARLRKLFGESSALWTSMPEQGGFEVGFSLPLKRRVQ